MSGKINEYALERFEFGDNDYYDIDYYDDINGVYKTAKISGQTIRLGLNPKLFAQTELLTPPFTGNVEGTIVGNGEGSLFIPANFLKVGDSFRLKLTGKLSSVNNDTLHIYIKVNGLVLADSGILTMPSVSDKGFSIEMDFTIQAIGGIGIASVVASGQFTYIKNSGNTIEGSSWAVVDNTNFDTGVDNQLDITAVFGSTNATNSIQSFLCVLNKTF